MDTFVDYLETMDYVSLGLVALPVVAIILCGFLLLGITENDTMQRNGSKASHNSATKAHSKEVAQQQNNHHHHQHHHNHNHNHHHHQAQHSALGKNYACDSAITTIGPHQHQHQQQQQAQQHNNQHHQSQTQSVGKQRKSRNNCKRQDGGNNAAVAATATGAQKSTAGFSVDEWLGRDMAYCYERRFMSSCAEDNILARHNPAHRNSTSSEAAASDDLNSSSSNEDLCATYTVLPKNSKKSAKARQKRQQKRKQLQTSGNGGGGTNNVGSNQHSSSSSNNNNNNNHNHNNNNNGETRMDIAYEGKENQRPNVQAGKQQGATASVNLRKQCTKAAALKAMNKGGNGNSSNGGSGGVGGGGGNRKCASMSANNTLVTSASNSSVASTLSAASSTLSLSSSVSMSLSSSASSPSNSANSSPTASPTVSKRSADNFKKIALALAPPLRQHAKLNLSEAALVQQLRRYIIDANLLRVYGYPVESAIHDGYIEIYKCLPKPFVAHVPPHHHHAYAHSTPISNVINTNDGLSLSFGTPEAEERKQRSDTRHSSTSDSGQGSGESSPPALDSDSSEPGDDEPTGTTACYTPDGSYQIFSQYDQSLEKQCVRCKRAFHVTETGDYLSREACVFHWGKLNHMYTGSNGFGYQYSCCQGDQTAEGCTRNELHVWTGAVVGLNGPYTDFVHTRPRFAADGRPPATKIYALDCEMSFTGRGLEVTKVTVVGYDGQLVYEHFVRPQAEIVDYNTRFSGVTAQDLCQRANKAVKTLAEVQRDLLLLFDAHTILIGHSLDNDLRALRIVHKTIIDTSITFPHTSGFPYRRALKHLTKVCLNRDIQCGEAGHSSFEDSRACLELMLWKVRKELRTE